MSLDMFGQIDDVFESIPATRTSYSGGGYVNGIYVDGVETTESHTVNVQPATAREIETLEKGGERIVDGRRVYVNDGLLASISQADTWDFDGQKWKCHALDNRPWRSYCRIIVGRFDVQL